MIDVILEAYWETGTEGVYWAVEDYAKMGEYLRVNPTTGRPEIRHKNPYAGLIILQAGHRLRIYADHARSTVLWQNTIDPETISYRQFYPWIATYFNSSGTELVDFEGCQEALRRFGFEPAKTNTLAQCAKLARTYFTRQVAGGMYCHWLQRDVEPDIWADWFSRKLPACLEAD